MEMKMIHMKGSMKKVHSPMQFFVPESRPLTLSSEQENLIQKLATEDDKKTDTYTVRCS
jgi:hypothetical protein